MTVKEAFSKFNKVQYTYEDYGACDTEPDAIMQWYVASKLNLVEGNTKLPESARSWELYEDEKGVNGAAKAMTKALLILEKELKELFFEEDNRNKIKQHLWRMF